MENQHHENQEEPQRSAKVQTTRGLIAQIVFQTLITLVWLATFNFWYLEGMSYQESYRWPKVTGEVISSKLSFSRNDKSMRRYYPLIRYQYVVNGDSYESDQVELVLERKSKSEVNRLLKDFKPKSEVLVYYHRDSPQKSLLIPGDEDSDFSDFIFYTGFMGVWALIVFAFGFSTFKTYLKWRYANSDDRV